MCTNGAADSKRSCTSSLDDVAARHPEADVTTLGNSVNEYVPISNWCSKQHRRRSQEAIGMQVFLNQLVEVG